MQETKWSESDVWPAWVFFHSGRPSPSSDEVVQHSQSGGVQLE